jgi:hypothetical protein
VLYLKDKLVKITSYRGEARNRVARVVDVRNIELEPLKQKSVERKAIERSRFLITIHDLTENVFRSYYHAYMQCEPIGFFGNLAWRLKKWLEDN